MTLPIDQIICGDAKAVMSGFPAASIDCIVTSPPYWGLRDYGVEGQLGLEPRPQEYLEKLWAIFDEVRRVLKPTGCCFVVIDDTYAGSRGKPDVPDQCRCMIPERFAWGMIGRGWWLRNDVGWQKSNPMPESCQRRFSCTWEHVYYFTKTNDHHFDLDAVREAMSPGSEFREKGDGLTPTAEATGNENLGRGSRGDPTLGKNPGDCWRIPTCAFPEAHFAVYPPDLIRKPIRAGCPAKVCVECGKPWVRVVETEGNYQDAPGRTHGDPNTQAGVLRHDLEARAGRIGEGMPRKTIGWQPTCECAGQVTCPDCKGLGIIYTSKQLRQQDEPENDEMYDKCLRCRGTGRVAKEGPTQPGTVLDPFFGAGTTGLVAIQEGRHYIGIDLSEEYCEMARKRLADVQAPLDLH